MAFAGCWSMCPPMMIPPSAIPPVTAIRYRNTVVNCHPLVKRKAILALERNQIAETRLLNQQR